MSIYKQTERTKELLDALNDEVVTEGEIVELQGLLRAFKEEIEDSYGLH